MSRIDDHEAPPVVVPEQEPESEPGSKPRLRIDEARRRSLQPWAIAGGCFVCLAVLAAGLTSTPLFDAKSIGVEGEKHLTERQVIRLAGISPDTNVLRLDEGAVRRRLERNPWIADAVVSTSLPSTVTISVTERVAVAVAITADGRVLVATDGRPLGTAAKGVVLPEVRLIGDPGGPGPAFDAVAAGAGVAGALPPVLRSSVEMVAIDTAGIIELHLADGVTVTYGGPIDLDLKAEAIQAILDHAAEEGRTLVSIDVTAPAAPTARFVGSPVVSVQPTDGASPSPSAGVEPSPSVGP
jgi:cell division protein FtsQ